jgi:plastocyanin
MMGWNRPGLRLIAAGPALALVVAACSAAAGAREPGPTYGPTPSPSVSPSMNMGPAAGGPTAGAPAASAPGLSKPSTLGGGGGATGSALHISAQNIAFNTNHLEAPAGQAFVLEFDNNDPGIPHNVEIKDANGTSVFKGQIITGPATTSYQVPALAAGSYTFVCDVHPNMTGTLAAQ